MECRIFCLRSLFGCFRLGDYLLCVSLCTKRVNPSQISMLNYVNTIIAIFLGWLILDEKITTKFIFAAILIISGVFIMNLKKEMFKSLKPRSLKSED